MDREFTIVIADRNRRIREFLGRELVLEGYHVRLVGDRHALSTMIRGDDTLDLLVLDDMILPPDEFRIVAQLENRIQPLAFIIHSFSTECVDVCLSRTAAALVEKRGNIGELKKAVKQVLRSAYPCRFDHSELRPE